MESTYVYVLDSDGRLAASATVHSADPAIVGMGHAAVKEINILHAAAAANINVVPFGSNVPRRAGRQRQLYLHDLVGQTSKVPLISLRRKLPRE